MKRYSQRYRGGTRRYRPMASPFRSLRPFVGRASARCWSRNKRDLIPKGQRPAALRGRPKVFTIETAKGTAILRRDYKGRHQNTLPYWLKRGVRIQPGFGFKATAGSAIAKHFAPNLVEALSQAMGGRRLAGPSPEGAQIG